MILCLRVQIQPPLSPGKRGKKVLILLSLSTDKHQLDQDETCDLYYKSFTIVIYDCNDSTIINPVL
jgi:hypothetical protein